MAKRAHLSSVIFGLAKDDSTATTVVTLASLTAPVSLTITPSYEDCLNGVVDVKVSALTNTSGTIILTLQDSSDGGTTWNTVKSTAAITATGVKTIRWNVQLIADQAYLPLRQLCRVVATTGALDSITVSAVRITAFG